MIKRWLLSRRPFDTPLLALAVALLAIGNPIAKWIFIFFGLIGVNLGFARHHTWRYADPAFCTAIIAYVSWTIGLILIRGEPFAGNRLLSYSGIILGFVFLPLSISLVREPLDVLILGSRAGIVAMLALLPFDLLIVGGRVSLGINAAIFAFLATTAGLAARLEARSPEAIFPNGRIWFYLSFIPVLFSQTRAAWPVYLLIALIDGMSLLKRRHWLGALRGWPAVAIAMLVLALAIPAWTIIENRLDAGMTEIEGLGDAGVASGSLGIRLVMWAGAAQIIAEHPIIGVGGTERMERVADVVSPDNADFVNSFTHLHNLFIDEAASSGLVGLALLTAIFAIFLVRVTRHSPGPLVTETSYAFVFFIATFGSFHGILLNEWMILSIFSFMTLILTEIRRDEFKSRFTDRRTAANLDAPKHPSKISIQRRLNRPGFPGDLNS